MKLSDFKEGDRIVVEAIVGKRATSSQVFLLAPGLGGTGLWSCPNTLEASYAHVKTDEEADDWMDEPLEEWVHTNYAVANAAGLARVLWQDESIAQDVIAAAMQLVNRGASEDAVVSSVGRMQTQYRGWNRGKFIKMVVRRMKLASLTGKVA